VEWAALVDRADASPCLRPGWFEAWWRAFGAGRLEILAVRRDGRLVAVLPLTGRGGRRDGPCNNETWMAGLVAEDAAAAHDLGRALFARGLRRVTLRRLRSAHPGLTELTATARDAGYRTLVATNERSPYLDLSGTWEECVRGLSKNVRGDLGRQRRRLAEHGEVTVEVHDGIERLDDLLAEGFRVEASGWKGEQHTAVLSRPQLRHFYTDLARWAAPRDLLRLAFLRVDGRAAAFFLCFETERVFYTAKVAYDAELARFSPGKVLLAAMIERAFTIGLERFDFLGTPDPYKMRWTGTCHEFARLHAFAGSPAGLAEWAAYRYGAPALKRLTTRSGAGVASPGSDRS